MKRRERKCRVLTTWFGLTKRRWPFGFWWDVGWEVKQRGIRVKDLRKVQSVVLQMERSEKWKSRTL